MDLSEIYKSKCPLVPFEYMKQICKSLQADSYENHSMNLDQCKNHFAKIDKEIWILEYFAFANKFWIVSAKKHKNCL